MIPLRSTVLRSLTRAGLNHSPRVFNAQVSRFQSTATAPKPETEVEATKDLSKHNGKKRYHVNRKLRDIINQIRSTSESSDLSESVEVLEEGLSYLREIQAVEGITEESFYYQFQNIITSILNKALAPGAELGGKTPEDVLDLLVEYKVAHEYHFTKYIVHELSQINETNAAEVFGRVLSTWVKNLEFSKGLSHTFNTRYSAAMREEKYQSYNMVNLVYFAYAMSCIKQNVPYSSADARKIIQRENALPSLFQVRNSLNHYGLYKSLKPEFVEFAATLERLNLEELDPNGIYVMSKLKEATTRNDWHLVDQIYKQAVESSTKNNTPIKQQTMINFMNTYHSLYRFDDVFRLFQDVLASGNTNPSEPIWDVVLRTMGHPSYIKRFNTTQKADLITNIDSTVSAFLQNGKTVDSKILSAIVGAYANLNRPDKVEEVLATYKDVPVSYTTKNNIMIGMLLNNDVSGAETAFNEYTQDKSFVPSTTVMNSFLSVYAKKKNFKAIEGIVEYMKKHKINEDVATYTILVDSYFKLYREKGIVPNVDDLLNLVIKDDKFFSREHSMSALLNGMISDGNNIEGARAIYEALSKKDKKTRNSPVILTLLIRGELDHGSVPNAEVLFQRFISKANNNTRIWNTMILGLLKKNEELSLSYYQKLKEQESIKAGVKPNYFTFYFLLDHFVKRNNKEKIQYFIDEIDASSLQDFGAELPQMLQKLSGDYLIPRSLLLRL